MSMISDLVERLRTEAKSMGTYGTDYMATLLTRSADTIEMLSAKVRADRPQGEWIEQEDCWQCSECGDEYVLEIDVKPIDAKMYYCPQCGCRMKGADDDD